MNSLEGFEDNLYTTTVSKILEKLYEPPLGSDYFNTEFPVPYDSDFLGATKNNTSATEMDVIDIERNDEDFWHIDPFDEMPNIEENPYTNTTAYRFLFYDRDYEVVSCVYLGNIRIHRVPGQRLGYKVLGRAFPWYGLIEIRDDLTGNDFIEVKTHEILHIIHPQMSEYNIRAMTKQALPFPTHFH